MTPTDALPVRGNCRVILNMHNGLSKCIAHTSRFNIVEEDVTVDIQRKGESMVFVLDTNRKPLSPCHPAVAEIVEGVINVETRFLTNNESFQQG